MIPGRIRTWAVGKAQGFPPLENSVNSRWISEQCAGGPNDEDEEDSKRTVARRVILAPLG